MTSTEKLQAFSRSEPRIRRNMNKYQVERFIAFSLSGRGDLGIVNRNEHRTFPPFCLFPVRRVKGSLAGQQSHLCGDGDGRGPGVDTQLAVNTGKMCLDGALRDPKLDGDLLAALAAG